MITLSPDDFDLNEEYAALVSNNPDDGAVITFVGRVRDLNQDHAVSAMNIECYPEMAKKVLERIISQARERWDINRVRVYHRYGNLGIEEQIVFIGVTSRHRGDAFNACEFIIDFLKTEAPFWKSEETNNGNRWVDANITDQKKVGSW